MSNPNAIILCIQGQHINLLFLFLTLNRWIPAALSDRQMSSQYLLVHSQQTRYQNNVWDLFKVYNKHSRTTSISFWCLYCYLWTNFTYCSGISIVGFEQADAGWIHVLTKSVFSTISLVLNLQENSMLPEALSLHS